MLKNKTRFLKAILWILSLSSAITLLGFLHGYAPMHIFGQWVLLPSLALISLIWFYAYKKGYKEIHKALLIGLIAGWIGTLGYDLIRIPLHYLGFNPFPPIRSYGMFIINSPHSTFLSDLAGILYHFSNGVTFAWLYTLIMPKRSLWWAILWSLVLESIAVFSAFGIIYEIRTAYTALGIAYFAHIFYGLPLGWFTQYPEKLKAMFFTPGKYKNWLMLGISTILVFLFLLTAWEPTLGNRTNLEKTIQLGPEAISSGWTRIATDEPLQIQNSTGEPLEFQIRKATERGTIEVNQTQTISIPDPGLYQIVVFDQPWRSAFIAVEKDGYLLK